MIVQRQVGEGSYDILGVGRLVQTTTVHSSGLIPVFIAFAEPTASEKLSVEQVVLWPPMVNTIRKFLQQHL